MTHSSQEKNVALTLWEDFGLESLPKKQVFQIIECLQRALRKNYFAVVLAQQYKQNYLLRNMYTKYDLSTECKKQIGVFSSN